MKHWIPGGSLRLDSFQMIQRRIQKTKKTELFQSVTSNCRKSIMSLELVWRSIHTSCVLVGQLFFLNSQKQLAVSSFDILIFAGGDYYVLGLMDRYKDLMKTDIKRTNLKENINIYTILLAFALIFHRIIKSFNDTNILYLNLLMIILSLITITFYSSLKHMLTNISILGKNIAYVFFTYFCYFPLCLYGNNSDTINNIHFYLYFIHGVLKLFAIDILYDCLDIEEDKSVKIQTFATQYGVSRAKNISCIIQFVGTLCLYCAMSFTMNNAMFLYLFSAMISIFGTFYSFPTWLSIRTFTYALDLLAFWQLSNYSTIYVQN